MKKLMIMMSAALLLTSCGLYNKYERPDVNTTGLIRDAVSDIDTLAVQDTASFGNLPWRSVFTDPQLQQLIEQGLAKNADLLNAALNVQMYETMLKAAKLAFLPAVNIGSAQQQMGSISTVHTDPSSTVKSYSFPATATWTLDLFGNGAHGSPPGTAGDNCITRLAEGVSHLPGCDVVCWIDLPDRRAEYYGTFIHI